MLGAIADDFTGATDLAAMLRRSGHAVVVVIEEGSVEPEQIEVADAVIVALKIRSAPAREAVDAALGALVRLQQWGADRFYVKYASTFDSTPEGNIGQVLDAIAERLGARRCAVVPALPENGRTVYQGHLFVHDLLLSESPMKDHPLNPMATSRVADILRPQTAREVSEIREPVVRAGASAIRGALGGRTGHIVIDAVDEEDLVQIGAALRDEVMVSGGSGLALGLGRGDAPATDARDWPAVRRGTVLCGSVSAATRRQIEVASEEAPVRVIDLDRAVAEPEAEIADLVQWVDQNTAPETEDSRGVRPVLCAARSLDDVVAEIGGTQVAEVVERVIASVAARLLQQGRVQGLLVAGGESSGAVVRALGIEVLKIGPELSPGVCWAAATPTAVSGQPMAIALKSGNFGSERLFLDAWSLL